MPKKIRFESGVHQFFAAVDRLRQRLDAVTPADARRLAAWARSTTVSYTESRLVVYWESPTTGSMTVPLKNARFYTRGDRPADLDAETTRDVTTGDTHFDPVERENASFFDHHLQLALAQASLFTRHETNAQPADSTETGTGQDLQRKTAEAHFHDAWAASVDVWSINVRKMNEACTAPEMRYIRSQLGDLSGRRLLDVGSGLGEASVYFALEGATVTASDVSEGMLDAALRLAEANGVTIKTVLSASEDLGLREEERFDIIYIGNTLHHVDITKTLDQVLPLLKPDGLFVSWDPLAYNPVINVYRSIATEVRTEDEHPLKVADLRLMKSRFGHSHTRFFWLTALTVFVWMAVFQRRSPNRERYWKKVVEEADSWAWLYGPLETFDCVLLRLMPFLGPLCWNVVFIGSHPRLSDSRYVS